MTVDGKTTPSAEQSPGSLVQRFGIRLLQNVSMHFSAVTQSAAPFSMFGQIVNITIAVVAFRLSVPLAALFVWAAAAYATPAYLLYRWIRRRVENVPRKPSPKVSRKAIAYAVALSAPWGVLGFWLLGQLPRSEELILIALCVGMAASGSVLLSGIYPAAIAYMICILTPVTIKCFLFLDGREYLLLGALSLSFGAFLVNCINSCYRLFAEKARAVDDLTLSLAKTEEAKKEVERAAFYDALTGLPNRRAFLNFSMSAEAQSQNSYAPESALFYIDLDQFKPVNDAHGHDVGDMLLQAVAARLASCLQPNDLLARLGGDEFTLIALGIPDQDVAEARAKYILDRISEPYNLVGRTLTVGASIGVALGSNGVTKVEALLKLADLALYKCKGENGNRYCCYHPSMLAEMEERRSTEAGLRHAVSKDQFELFYQPLFDLRSQELIGAEALIRWRHPERGLILPGDFLPMAEEMRLLDGIGAWVLERAFREAALWPDHLCIAVNLSPNQVVDTEIAGTISDLLGAAGLPPQRVELEVTESVILNNDSKTQRKLSEMKSLGVKLSMDDFGTGYSSLAYLSRFPFDRIKIDRTFVSGMMTDNSCASIVRATVDLARSLNLLTTAEGVETDAQLNELTKLGVDVGQGYLFSKPLSAADFAAFLLKTLTTKKASHNATREKLFKKTG